MKTFCFTVDDNIRCLRQINEKNYDSIFDHPYLAVYKRLHERFGLKVQLNLFYQEKDFNLSQFTNKYYNEFESVADWLKLSFHSNMENVRPYEFSNYDEVYNDCHNVNEQIVRFASPKALAKTTTIHFCLATEGGIKALSDNKIIGLLGLFGTNEKPRSSYTINEENAKVIRLGNGVKLGEITYKGIDIVLNSFSKEEILSQLEDLKNRNHINVMIHEQYFYKDYHLYQEDFEEKLAETFLFLTKNGFSSKFFEEII